MKKAKLESSSIWLKKRYIEEQKSIAEMAKEAGCSELTIRRRLRENGLMR